MKPLIAIVNESTKVSDADVQRWMAAEQQQVSGDFAPIWDTDAQLECVPRGVTVPVGTWQLVLLDDSDQANALGYHELTANGDPLGKAFIASDIADGVAWSVTASHELLEMLGDPQINRTIEVDGQDGSIKFYALEVCDACESDSCGYRVDDVLLSDFVTPAWFMLGGAAPFDRCRKATAPLQILPDGYISIFDGQEWAQIFGQRGNSSPLYRIPRGCRRWRRNLPDLS
ncbi:MAG: hypothetical protein ACRD4V_02800, partial [Candidatus Acidiferrales bacterium]